MKSPVLIITSLIILAAGIAMCWFNSSVDILRVTVLTIGTAFTLGGVINLIGISVSRHREKIGSLVSTMSWISGVGGIILGLFLLIFPEVIIPYLVYLFGALLVLGGVTLICLMAWGNKDVVYPGYYYILPVIILIDGIVIVSTDNIFSVPQRMVLFTGVGFILFGISSLLNLTSVKIQEHAVNVRKREQEKEQENKPEDKAAGDEGESVSQKAE